MLFFIMDVQQFTKIFNRLGYEAKLDSIQCNKCYTDTIYVDVDDMMQADWQSYTPANKD